MGEIITFYSYTGGSGQSMAVANIATLLTRWGYETLVIDWNLEAPGGIERVFEGHIASNTVPQKEGILELLYSAQDLAGIGLFDKIFDPDFDAGSAPPVISAQAARWKQFVVPVDLNFGNRLSAEGVLELLSAGHWSDPDYAEKLHSFDVRDFYEA